jgi:hypothetical protein
MKKGDKVLQRATHPDRVHRGVILEVADTGLTARVRWHAGFWTWEAIRDLELDNAPT